MFTAYFDASGHPADSTVVSVAGFVGGESQWMHFERNWQETLDDFGAKALHMKDFAHSKGEFSMWANDEQRRREFLRRLIGIIRCRASHSFAVSIWMQDYEKIDKGFALHETYKPYALAGCACLGGVKSWAKRIGEEFSRINFIFEDGDKDKGNLMERAESLGVPLRFEKKASSHAFEAADLLAYEHFQVNKKLVDASPEQIALKTLRMPLMELREVPGGGEEDGDWRLYSEDDLISMCKRSRIPKR